MPLHMATTRLPPITRHQQLVWALGSAVVGMADDERLALRAWARGGTPESRVVVRHRVDRFTPELKTGYPLMKPRADVTTDYLWSVADMGDRYVRPKSDAGRIVNTLGGYAAGRPAQPPQPQPSRPHSIKRRSP
jgi:hypothetical protein